MNRISCKLSDLVEVKNGSTPSTTRSDFYDGNIVWITPKDLSNNKSKYVYNSERRITKAGFDSCSTSLLPIGSVLLSSRAPIGLLAICAIETCTNQGFKNLVIKKNKINNEYLYYWLKTKVKYIDSLGTGTTFKEVSKGVIENLEIELPENINDQQKIASVLSSLDSKIELNNRINAELEAMAKTLYDYWFVQFDFTNAKGKPYKTSGGKMNWNEKLKRDVPVGWEVKTLLDIATFVNGLACQKFRPKENEDSYRVIKIREMGTGFTENTEFVSTNIPEKVVVYNGDILFSWSATLDVKIWTGGTGALNQHIFKITSKKYPKGFYYFELLNYLQHFKMMAELRKTTMGHITQDHLRESRITIPPIEIINELDKIVKPILEKKVKLEIENQKLTELRDWLLPMLMNGQVRVN
ncbi:MAG: restriction endonuclease subunit S [Flavobacteriales bacterium]|nr:restriction endonuclease subunit S [Flavobacteriales bacterium]